MFVVLNILKMYEGINLVVFFFIKSEDYCDVSTMAPCHILNPQSLLHEDLKQSNSKTRNQYFYKICKKKKEMIQNY